MVRLHAKSGVGRGVITKLCEMAELYHTDKARWYTPFYHLILEPHRFEYRKILEVGIGTKEAMGHVPGYMPGASLFMWCDYFPNAAIYGVDSAPRAQVSSSRIQSVLSDSRSPELPAQLGKDFDLIVDDGAHTADVQFETFLNLFPLLKDGGLYIIEDAEEWRELSERLEGYTHQIVLAPIRAGSAKLILVQK